MPGQDGRQREAVERRRPHHPRRDPSPHGVDQSRHAPNAAPSEQGPSPSPADPGIGDPQLSRAPSRWRRAKVRVSAARQSGKGVHRLDRCRPSPCAGRGGGRTGVLSPIPRSTGAERAPGASHTVRGRHEGRGTTYVRHVTPGPASRVRRSGRGRGPDERPQQQGRRRQPRPLHAASATRDVAAADDRRRPPPSTRAQRPRHVLRPRRPRRRGLDPPRRRRGDRPRPPARRPHPARRPARRRSDRRPPMSSHREAPEISKDPVADSTDVYAFVSPDRPDTVTIITNYIPLEDPAGGPNFFEFGDDVLYSINIDNDNDGRPEIVYEFTFTTTNTNPNSFLYNTGAITSLDDPDCNRRQTYDVWRGPQGRAPSLGNDLLAPPCNVGIRSTPNYPALANSAIHDLSNGIHVFAGQRLDAFFVDLGSVFDLAALRPFQNLHMIPRRRVGRSERAAGLQRPQHRNPGPDQPTHGKWQHNHGPARPVRHDRRLGFGLPAQGHACATATGQSVSARTCRSAASATRCSTRSSCRSGARTSGTPRSRSRTPTSLQYVKQPELAQLLPVLYPGVFPNLAARTADRADLVAILLTGIPAGIIDGFQNFTGPDLRRPTAAERGDPAGREPERLRPRRRRPCWVPERAAGVRRHRHHRAAGRRRADYPVGRPDLHARWRGQADRRWHADPRRTCSMSSPTWITR